MQLLCASMAISVQLGQLFCTWHAPGPGGGASPAPPGAPARPVATWQLAWIAGHASCARWRASPQVEAGWTPNWVPAAPGSLNALADRLHTERQSARARERTTGSQTERERQRDRERETERQRETESRDRETETERDRETESHSKDVRARARARQSAAARGGVRGATSEIRQD